MCAGRIATEFCSDAVVKVPARFQNTRIVDEPVAELVGAPVPWLGECAADYMSDDPAGTTVAGGNPLRAASDG